MTHPTLSRRTLIRSGAGAAVATGTVLAIGIDPAGAADTRATFRLDSSASIDHCTPAVRNGARTPTGTAEEERATKKEPATAEASCASCNACRFHGENKVFATKEAADAARAHPGCRCAIAEGPAVSPAVYEALFFDNERQSVDRRDPKTAELLANDDATGVPVPILAPTVPILLAAAGGLWWWRSRGSADQGAR